MTRFCFYIFLLFAPAWGIEQGTLKPYLEKHPFEYDMNITLCEFTNHNADVMLCCHGAGGDENIAPCLYSHKIIPDHLIGFRFPDFGTAAYTNDPHQTHFGTIEELLPLLYLMKTLVVDAGLEKLNLYGFSAGGGAVINALSILTQNRYPEQLASIGMTPKETQTILDAVQNGFVILDTPLKSVDEVRDLRGSSEELEVLATRYTQNNLRPIDSISSLSSLKLKILLYFQDPDEVIYNRDDQLYIKRLLKANSSGKTHVVIADNGGHSAIHTSLWQAYTKIMHKNTSPHCFSSAPKSST